MLGGQPNRRWRLCCPLWLRAGGSGFGLCNGSDLGLSVDWVVGVWCFGCLLARRGLAVGFLLLRCSVLFAVGSLSLLCLLVVSWFICLGDDALVGWGSFMQAKYLCVLIHI